MLNIFSLHGKYFQNHENRFTANVLFLLSESRADFFPAFLQLIGVNTTGMDISGAEFTFQSQMTCDGARDVPDAEIRIGEDLSILLEAKIGHNPLNAGQLVRYAKELRKVPGRKKKLVVVTQVNERRFFL